MQIAIDRTAEVLPDELRSFEIELEAADQVDVERVQIRQQRFQAQPTPGRDTTAQPLATALVGQVVQRYSIVRVRHLDRGGVGRSAIEPRHELAGGLREIAAHLEDGDEFPFGRERGIQRTQGISDPSPLLDRRIVRVTPVNDVPDEAAYDSDALLSRHRVSARAITITRPASAS